MTTWNTCGMAAKGICEGIRNYMITKDDRKRNKILFLQEIVADGKVRAWSHGKYKVYVGAASSKERAPAIVLPKEWKIVDSWSIPEVAMVVTNDSGWSMASIHLPHQGRDIEEYYREIEKVVVTARERRCRFATKISGRYIHG